MTRLGHWLACAVLVMLLLVLLRPVQVAVYVDGAHIAAKPPVKRWKA